MKERPILFKDEMVRAILSGAKTQTRRVVKPQPHPEFLARGVHSVVPQWPHQDGVRWFMNDGASELVKSKFGQPGDRLWVRETWQGPIMEGDEFENRYHDDPAKFQTPEYCFYAADGGSAPEFVDADDNLRCCWRPSIHMPRWACRIELEIVSVRVERLNRISIKDAIAEGARSHGCFDAESFDPIDWYEDLWESINGEGSWAANPWVWVIEFKKVAA